MNKALSALAGSLLGLTLVGPTVQAAAYTVKEGDTLWKIATANSASVQQLYDLNPSITDMLYAGQTIQLPEDPRDYTVQPGDTFWKLSLRFGVSTSALIHANTHIANPDVLNVGDRLHIPSRPAAFANGTFPLNAGTYTPYTNNYAETRTWSPNGDEIRPHEGVDIFAPKGTPVYSVLDGTIVNYGWNQYGGWRLTVQTDDSTAFYYAHLSGYAEGIAKGGTVKQGQLIGYVGNTGYGPEGTEGLFDTHLHFGIYKTAGTWTTVDPFPYLTWWEQSRP
ncbi:LysM peptidoglycan-binding domain-containing protein [Paenibacillus hodogayensis]|uniref:LysM peptidoglycan-binding domain-containing protein n=1 Tax=Paenibacillus hodogayensis TaxID=279208 RepID=A0ABV5VS58_9BACL